MHLLLNPFGSSGDVHPFLGLGLALRDRGHRVTFLTTPHFGPLIGDAGFDFLPLGDEDRFEEALRDPDLWHPTRSLKVVARSVGRGLRDAHRAIRDLGTSVGAVVAGALSFGARVAREEMGVPLVTLHLQPGAMRSLHDTPVFGGVPMPRRAPRWYKRIIFGLGNRFADRAFGPEVNPYLLELGLPPARKVLDTWWHSPDLVLAMFPDWYAPRQPDWPAPLVQAGFPLYDESDVTAADPELEAFLASGTPPVVFAPGSAMTQGQTFFAESARACQLRGCRGLFVTRFPDQIPAVLPDGVRHFPYVPFSRVLPRASAIVHHGGIGTAAQALAAGIPQLVRPLAFDQFDNADRLRRLGVGGVLTVRRYRAESAARALDDLAASASVARDAASLAARIRRDRPMVVACEAIEGVARG